MTLMKDKKVYFVAYRERGQDDFVHVGVPRYNRIDAEAYARELQAKVNGDFEYTIYEFANPQNIGFTVLEKGDSDV